MRETARASSMRPPSRGKSPASAMSVVLLPQPEGPINEVIQSPVLPSINFYWRF